jgi:hypothetical protein
VKGDEGDVDLDQLASDDEEEELEEDEEVEESVGL